MRIAMTGDTRSVFKEVAMRLDIRWFFVTVRAGRRSVCSREFKPGGAMPYQRERRRHEAVHGMTCIALVLISRQELSCMRILMAVRTRRELRMIVDNIASSGVTLLTRDFGVFAGQRILSRCMSLDVERPAFKSINRMAGSAVSAVQPFSELTVMLVAMTVEAEAACNPFAEIGRLVAGGTRNG
jgi:hypothetical protein